MTFDETKLNRRSFLFTASQIAALSALDPGVCRALKMGLPVDLDGTPIPAATPHNIYSIRVLSEQELLQTYQQLLTEACQNAATEWHMASFDQHAGYWGDGASSGNGGIRTVVSMLLACTTLLRYGAGVDDSMREYLRAKSFAAIRFTTATHRTGSAQCPDGRKWGAIPGFGPGSWQTGMWTGTLAWASLLIWDRLSTELQASLERVIAWECDILSNRIPPDNLWLDTKAEENGWEVPCLVMGALMFSSHPHAAEWQQAAYLYMMNTLSTEADTHDRSIVDGRPVNEWIKGANLQPDFTLENHNIFHPAYVGCSCYFLTQAVLYYTFSRRPVPESATHHLLDTWRMFQAIILPWGEAACPQGMDWELHALPFINLYASLATRWRDPLAAHFEQCSLQYLRAWQIMCHGSLATPGSPFGFVRHAINAEQASYGFLAHKIFGPSVRPMSAHGVAAAEEGVRDYPYVDFIAHRTLKKYASFSWKNRIMGLLIPLGDPQEGNPDFTAPIRDGLVGSFETKSTDPTERSGDATVLEHTRLQTTQGFETSGTLLLHGAPLRQTLRVISVGDQVIVYEDLVTALKSLQVTAEYGLPIGIENDEITGGTRVMASEHGRMVFDWKHPQPRVAISGSWVNIDGRLGLAVLAGSGISYVQAQKYSPGISIYSDVLYGSFCDQRRDFKAGEVVAHRLGVLAVEVTAQQTAALAMSCSVAEESGHRILRFRTPQGAWIELRLPRLLPANANDGGRELSS